MRGILPDSLDQILSELRLQSIVHDELSAYLWFDQKYYLPDDILMKVDRMSMAHAVEVRPPFLDHRIVEFAAALPSRFKMNASGQKFVLKQLMRDKLPAAILNRTKNGLDIPTHEWLRGPLRPLLLDAVASAAAEHPGVFNAEVIESHLRDHLGRRANLGYHLWGLMILFLWMKKWRIQTAPISPLRQRSTEKILTST
jgi:asparagine synthase (glutamine-hydrolysing)